MAGMFHISEAASLALHTMAILAGEEGRILRTKEIAARLGASEAHLAKVMQRLGRSGLVNARRGPGGGYTLAKPADQVTLLQVYEAIEGRLEIPCCLLGKGECAGPCIMGGLLAQVGKAAGDYFSGTRLSDISQSHNCEVQYG